MCLSCFAIGFITLIVTFILSSVLNVSSIVMGDIATSILSRDLTPYSLGTFGNVNPVRKQSACTGPVYTSQAYTQARYTHL